MAASHRSVGSRLALWSAVTIGLALVARTGWLVSESVALARVSEPLQHAPARPAMRLLIVGDSTAVGTGTSVPQASVAGLLSRRFPRLHIDNRARDGATFAGVLSQLAGDAPVDMVLVMAGGNDVVRLRRQSALQADVEHVVARARQRAGLVVLMPAGNVGSAPFFLPPLSWLMTWRSRRLLGMVVAAASRHGALVVTLFREPADDPFVQQPHLNASDGLHPSEAGYRVWFGQLMAQAGLMQRLSPALGGAP